MVAVLALLAIGMTARTADAQVGTGTMNLHLLLPPGTGLTQTWADTSNASIGWNQVIVFGGGTGPFTLTALPAANGYRASVSAISTLGELCTGFDENVPVAANETTIVVVSLTCVPPSAVKAPAIGRFTPVLGLSLAALGAIALRRRARSLRRGG
jgi:hypothetical protein